MNCYDERDPTVVQFSGGDRIRAENVPPVYIFCIGQTENNFDFFG